jgi:hypothetical protein
MINGALKGVDQLCHGRENRAVVVGDFAVSGLCEPALDGFSAIGDPLCESRCFARRGYARNN